MIYNHKYKIASFIGFALIWCGVAQLTSWKAMLIVTGAIVLIMTFISAAENGDLPQ